MIWARLITGICWERAELAAQSSPEWGCVRWGSPQRPCPVYLVVTGELVEELVPVLRVVVDSEVATDVQVQQQPAGAAHLELVEGFWEGERRSAPPPRQTPAPARGRGGGSEAPTPAQAGGAGT